MIIAILICISSVLLGASWIIYQKNFELFMCLLIAVYNEFFYLAPRIIGPDDYKLLLLPIVLVLLAVNLFTGKLAFGRYGWWVITFLGVTVFGIIVAWFAGQSFSLGIKTTTSVPLILVYFLLAGRRINSEKFANYFIAMALAVAFIASIQFIVHSRIKLFPGMTMDMLFPATEYFRVSVGQFVISAAAVVAFARYQQSSRGIFLLAAVLLFGEVLVVQQIRGFIVGILLSMFIVYMLSHKLTALRLSIYIIFAGFCLGAWMFLSGVNFGTLSLVKRTQSDFSRRGQVEGSSYLARLNAYNYYWKQIQEHPVTGRGIWNINWEGDNERYLGIYRGIFLSDIGIVHFIVETGLIGAIWLMWGLMKLWRDIFRFRGQLVIACYFIVATITMPTLDIMLRQDSLFLFAVFLGISSSMITNLKTDPALAVA